MGEGRHTRRQVVRDFTNDDDEASRDEWTSGLPEKNRLLQIYHTERAKFPICSIGGRRRAAVLDFYAQSDLVKADISALECI